MSALGRQFAEDRTVAAARCVAETRASHRHFRHYVTLVRQLPLLLHRHGLGQTLSYIKIRSGDRATSTYEVIYRQLTERMAQLFPLGNDDLMDYVTKIDSQQYMRLAIEAEAFVLAWQRAARAATLDKSGSSQARPTGGEPGAEEVRKP